MFCLSSDTECQWRTVGNRVFFHSCRYGDCWHSCVLPLLSLWRLLALVVLPLLSLWRLLALVCPSTPVAMATVGTRVSFHSCRYGDCWHSCVLPLLSLWRLLALVCLSTPVAMATVGIRVSFHSCRYGDC